MRAARACAAVLLALAALRASAGETVHLLACRDDLTCATSMEAVAGARFVWLWSAAAPPVRVRPADVAATIERGLARGGRATIEVPRRGEAVVQLLAAPAEMWAEVPEPLLPRFDVPKSGSVRVPRTPGVPWKARLIARDAGSWWTPLRTAVTSIPLLPAETRRVRITGEHGAPLAAAMAVLAPGAGTARTLDAQFVANRAGWIEIEGLPDREPLTLVLGAEGYAPAALTERVTQLPETVELRRGVRVQARFVDADERPLAGVRVRAEAWLDASGAVVGREAVSDERGAWTIDRLPAGTRAVLVSTREGLASLRKQVVVENDLDLGDIRLERGATLAVRVRDDASGRPVAGARVRAAPLGEARTDAKGIARLADLPAEALDLAVTADDHLPAKTSLSPPFDALVEIALTRAFVVTGRFVDAGGVPIAGASARVTTGNFFRDVELDGASFRIAGEPDRPMTIELASPASRTVRIEVEGKSGETRDLGEIRADPGVVIRGRVVTAAGVPVASGSVWAPRSTAAGPIVNWASGNSVRAETDADGAFVLRGAGPEPLLLRFDAPGLARGFRSVSFDAERAEVDLGEVVLARGATVTVLGKSDDAVVRVMHRPETSDIDALTAQMRGGVATIRNVPPGRAVVTVHREHSTVCRKEIDVDAPVTVDCTADAVRVRGAIFVGERRADGGMLLWTSPADIPIAGLIVNDTSPLGARSQRSYGASSGVLVSVAANGEFDSAELRPGTWHVQWTSAANGVAAPREVVIPEQADVSLVLRYDEAVVHGTVVDERAEPVREASVRQVNGGAWTITADDGTFAIAGLAPGTYRFRAEGRGAMSDSAVVEIESGRQPDPLRMMLRRGGGDELALRVLTARGSPAAGALVFVETSAGETRIVTTDGAGSVTVAFEDGVPATMRFAAFHEGAWLFDEWRPAESLRDGVPLRFAETGALAVSVASGAALDIVAPAGWNLRMLLMRIGWVPALDGDAPLHLTGLPPGSYALVAGTKAAQATVRRGETARVTLR